MSDNQILEANMALCPDCNHRVGAHHVICGCQHLTPYYNENGVLKLHDRCKCRKGVEADARRFSLGD
jgi:hypothetical protein